MRGPSSHAGGDFPTVGLDRHRPEVSPGGPEIVTGNDATRNQRRSRGPLCMGCRGAGDSVKRTRAVSKGWMLVGYLLGPGWVGRIGWVGWAVGLDRGWLCCSL